MLDLKVDGSVVASRRTEFVPKVTSEELLKNEQTSKTDRDCIFKKKLKVWLKENSFVKQLNWEPCSQRCLLDSVKFCVLWTYFRN